MTEPPTVIEHDTALITIRRFFTAEGRDLVAVDTDDMSGEALSVVEALGAAGARKA